MKKILFLVLFVGLFGAISASFAQCQTGNCDQLDQVTQQINVTVPSIVKLVIDNATTDSNSPLGAWNVYLSTDMTNKDLRGCYVIPNWVGFTESLNQFLQAAGVGQNGDFSGLVPAKARYGYPPVIRKANGKVKTWSQVVDNAESPYVVDHANDPAKGNLLCTNALMIEKYTNCDGVGFFVSLSGPSGYGSIRMTDAATISGTDKYVGGAGLNYFHEIKNDNKKVALLGVKDGEVVGIPKGVWIDDNITQLLWLKNSSSGIYDLTATYTLGTAVAASYNQD